MAADATITYINIKKLIERNRYKYDDLLGKMDIFLLNSRITNNEYTALKSLMDKKIDHDIPDQN